MQQFTPIWLHNALNRCFAHKHFSRLFVSSTSFFVSIIGYFWPFMMRVQHETAITTVETWKLVVTYFMTTQLILITKRIIKLNKNSRLHNVSWLKFGLNLSLARTIQLTHTCSNISSYIQPRRANLILVINFWEHPNVNYIWDSRVCAWCVCSTNQTSKLMSRYSIGVHSKLYSFFCY